MKKIFYLILLTLLYFPVQAQQWMDKIFSYDSTLNITYGTAINFAEGTDTLKMDVYSPICSGSNPDYKRPLILLVHGGAFLEGDKSEGSIKRLCKEFAQRGYLAASINYRLGFISDEGAWSCNYPNYSCVFATDSAEWYRAYYRAVQDGKGALRYLINRNETYKIDTNNVFIVGESAGAILALGVALLDTISEKPLETYAISYAPTPNQNALSCSYNLGKTFPNATILRPDLGSIDGDIEPSNIQYTIKGVGNMYGAMMSDLLKNHKSGVNKPAIFSYHQPCDLVVPIDSGHIFAGLSWCMTNGYNCYGIAHTPKIYGSRAISSWNTTNNYGYNIHNEFTTTEFPYNFLFGTASCADQVNNPCHAYDNANLRIGNLIQFFAPLVTTSSICDTTTSIHINKSKLNIRLYPNPTKDLLNIHFGNSGTYHLTIFNTLGQSVWAQKVKVSNNDFTKEIDLKNLKSGVYLLHLTTMNGEIFVEKFVKQ